MIVDEVQTGVGESLFSSNLLSLSSSRFPSFH